MKFVFKLIVISCLGFASLNTAWAKNFDGSIALKMCQMESPETLAGCSMFILGSAETLRLAGLSGVHYCLPSNVQNKQLKSSFISYLNNNSDKQGYSAASLFYASLIEAYPCE